MASLTPMMILRKKIRNQIRQKKDQNKALENLIRALSHGEERELGNKHYPEQDIEITRNSTNS